MAEVVLLLCCAMLMSRALFAAADDAQPSVELLEYLGELQTGDGEWFDPLWLAEGASAQAQPVTAPDQHQAQELSDD
jgi:hypothetical protein